MQGRTVLYTGAAGGLGLKTTLALMARGATVIAVDNDPVKVADLTAAAEGEGAGRLIVSTVDLSDLEAFRAELKRQIADTGGIDVVINNAAIYPSKAFEDYTVEDHQAVQRVNVDAGIVAVQEALPGMKARGFGRIINISSITLSGGWANLSPYVASKGALVGLTRAWAREFGPHGRRSIPTPRATTGMCWSNNRSSAGVMWATSPTPSPSSPPTRRASSPDRRCT